MHDYHDDDTADEAIPGLTPAERELEAALRAVKPAQPRRIDRDRLLYQSGAAAARRSLLAWRAAAAVLVGALGVAIAARSGEPKVVREVVYVDRVPSEGSSRHVSTKQHVASAPLPPETIEAYGDSSPAASLLLASGEQSSYLVLRDRALRWGIAAALPPTSGSARPAPPLRADDLFDAPADRQRQPTPPAAPSLKSLLFPGDKL
jgi:hypothetical protein